jgi:8-oxo-dGTP diphosphatase
MSNDVRARAKQIVCVELILRQEGKVFCKARKNASFLNGYWAFPAGHAENEESCIDAALRELKEEVGVSTFKKYLRVVHIQSQKGTDGRRTHIFIEVMKWLGKPRNAEPKKAALVAWLEPGKERGRKFVPSEVVAWKCIQKGITISEFDYQTFLERGQKKLVEAEKKEQVSVLKE